MADGSGSQESPLGAAAARPASGRRYVDSVVGFLDALAAKALSERLDFLNAMVDTVELEQRLTSSWKSGRIAGFRTTWFSDNVGVSMPTASTHRDDTAPSPVDHVAWFVGDLQSCLLAQFGVLSRGGIAVGPNHHDDRMIFGPALVEAYELERTIASAPRVVLSPRASDLLNLDVVPTLPSDDGYPWLDYLRIGLPTDARRANYFEAIKTNLCRGRDNAPDDDRREKWLWSIRYFNGVVAELAPDGVEPVGD